MLGYWQYIPYVLEHVCRRSATNDAATRFYLDLTKNCISVRSNFGDVVSMVFCVLFGIHKWRSNGLLYLLAFVYRVI